MTYKELKRKIQSHQYSYKTDEKENRERIEKELESENHHGLVRLLRSNNYTDAFELIEKENSFRF